jgi:mono/diheme cytochrome c family protein
MGLMQVKARQCRWCQRFLVMKFELDDRQFIVIWELICGCSPTRLGIAAISFGLSLVAWSLAADTNAPSFQPKLPDASLWPQGRYVYQRNCLVCHGTYGDGRGEMGRELKPRPRNFERGLFKYHSTPAGALPSDADLERIIRGGLTGTAMPVFTNLSEREIKSVIEYVKSFSPRWRNPTNYAPALALPPLPAWFGDEVLLKSRVAKGRNLFSAACAACHGVNGNGRETTAKNLEDSWGEPVPATDLRQPALRSGRTLETVYRVLLTGIDGTPMPSFAETMTEEQRWELVAFIAQLRREHAVENSK